MRPWVDCVCLRDTSLREPLTLDTQAILRAKPPKPYQSTRKNLSKCSRNRRNLLKTNKTAIDTLDTFGHYCPSAQIREATARISGGAVFG